MKATEAAIKKILEPKLEEKNFFIVDIKLSSNKIQVFIDNEEGITISECASFSRYLEKELEEQGLVNENYILEVSSPGITQPLKLLRQYRKNVGREISVILKDGDKREGKLLSADDDNIKIEEEVKQKGKKADKKETEIPLNDIKETKLKIKF